MKVYPIRTPADRYSIDLLKRSYRLRHTVGIGGREAIRRPDRCDVDAIGTDPATVRH